MTHGAEDDDGDRLGASGTGQTRHQRGKATEDEGANFRGPRQRARSGPRQRAEVRLWTARVWGVTEPGRQVDYVKPFAQKEQARWEKESGRKVSLSARGEGSGRKVSLSPRGEKGGRHTTGRSHGRGRRTEGRRGSRAPKPARVGAPRPSHEAKRRLAKATGGRGKANQPTHSAEKGRSGVL